MERYKNLSRSSGIAAFAIGADFIRVWFKGDAQAYRYQLTAVGRKHFGALKTRAQAGSGLSTYISRHREALPFTRD